MYVVFHPDGQQRLGQLGRMVLVASRLYMQIHFYNVGDVGSRASGSGFVISRDELKSANKVARVVLFASDASMSISALHCSVARGEAHFTVA